MVTVLIIAIIALAVAIAALVISLKRQKVVKETKIIVENAPASHPFTYESKSKTYVLNGNLKVNGFVSCIERKEE